MPTDMIAAYGVAIAALVAAAVGVLVKPLVEALPFANPAAPRSYNGKAHDALLRASNVALNVAGVLLMGLASGQVSLANWLPVTLQIAAQALGAHVLYQAIKPGAPITVPVVVSNAAVASALNAAIAATEQPTPISTPISAPISAPAAPLGQPNAVKTLADSDPNDTNGALLQPTMPALPAITSAVASA